jgi:F0F1-type ATP synthase assembly protein I
MEPGNAADNGQSDVGRDQKDTLSGARFAGFGVQFVAAILVFLYLGRWVDGKLGTAPLFLIVGVFVGAGASFYAMYLAVTRKDAR